MAAAMLHNLESFWIEHLLDTEILNPFTLHDDLNESLAMTRSP